MVIKNKKRVIKEKRKGMNKINQESFDKEKWKPQTGIGKSIKNNETKDIDNILDKGSKTLEAGIVDALIPNLETDLLLIGQSKGKFGGGRRRVFRQTQKKTREGNKPQFAAFAIVGDKNGHIGLGYGKSKETVPSREKAIRSAKLNMIKIRRGCGSWQCGCKEPHTIPFFVDGKCGSTRIRLMPAPKGTGLCAESECQKMLRLAGIKDIWSKTFGRTKTKLNLILACFNALKQLIEMKVQNKYVESLAIVEGKSKEIESIEPENVVNDEEDSKDDKSKKKVEKKEKLKETKE